MIVGADPIDTSALVVLPCREGVIRQRTVLFQADDTELPAGTADLLRELVEFFHDGVIDEAGPRKIEDDFAMTIGSVIDRAANGQPIREDGRLVKGQNGPIALLRTTLDAGS